MALLYSFILISGCATYPESPEEQVAFHIDHARSFFEKGQHLQAAQQIDSALLRPTGKEKVKNFFSENSAFQDIYFKYLDDNINAMRTTLEVAQVLGKINTAESSGIFNPNQFNLLSHNFNDAIANGNKSGKLPFDLSDNLKSLPILQSPDHYRIIVDRTIGNLQGKSSIRTLLLNSLMDYVGSPSVNSLEKKRIELLLPSMNIKPSEIGVVAKFFPEFAREATSHIAAPQPQVSDKLSSVIKAPSREMAETKSLLVEACNAITDSSKRLQCLKAAISKQVNNDSQEVDELRKAFGKISAKTKAGINIRKYSDEVLDLAASYEAYKVSGAVDQRAAPHFEKAFDAYNDARTFWDSFIKNSKDVTFVGRVAYATFYPINQLTQKYKLNVEQVMLAKFVRLQPSLSTMWNIAEDEASKGFKLLEQ